MSLCGERNFGESFILVFETADSNTKHSYKTNTMPTKPTEKQKESKFIEENIDMAVSDVEQQRRLINEARKRRALMEAAFRVHEDLIKVWSLSYKPEDKK